MAVDGNGATVPAPGHGHGPGGGGRLLTDLLQPLEALADLVAGAIDDSDWLDVFLLAAAGAQVLEDVIGGPAAGTGPMWWWSQLSNELDAPGRARQTVLTAARWGVAATSRAAERTRMGRALAAAAAAMARVRDAAAPVAARLTGEVPANIASLLEAAVLDVGRLPDRVRSEVLRLPSSFRSFDQHPEDIGELVRRASVRWPDRSRPVVAVGVRTSGSYLAPLAAAYLRAMGYEDVAVVTLRPGVEPSAGARKALERVTAGPGLALVVDDPPVSGRSIARTAARLEKMGAPPAAVVLLLAWAGPGGEPPATLGRYPRVDLEWSEWHVQRLLAPGRVACVLEHLAVGYQVGSCLARPQQEAARRGHVQARYDVVLLPAATGVVEPAELVVEGTGLGLFGRYALAVSRALGPAVAPVLGFVDGLTYRLEPPGGWPAGDITEASAAAAVAAYVKRRQVALPAPADRAQVLGGRLPVWEAATRALAPALGRPEPLLRQALLAPFAKRLLSARVPSVVDGNMAAANWYDDGDGLVKSEAATGAFWNFDLACYDALYDMAAASAQADLVELHEEAAAAASRRCAETSLPEPGAAAASYVRAWEQVVGYSGDEERWLTYRLVHLWDLRRRGELNWEMWGRASSRAVNSYMASVYLADVAPPSQWREGTGPCALDLDGCLEGGALGFSAVTAPGALALRALRAHCVPVLLATGRSLGETAERSATFGLFGAAAEYGAVAYDAASATATAVVPEAQLDAMASLRERLYERGDVELSPFHGYSIRARRAGDGEGRRLGPDAVGDLGDAWQVVTGHHQTDIVPAGADKVRALRLLMGAGPMTGGPAEEGGLLSLAVGDTKSDLAMLRAARLGIAPANCDDEVRRSGVTVVGAGHQDGVAEAVTRLLGHRPGACAACRAPTMGKSRRQLTALLSSHSGGPRRMMPLLTQLASTWAPARRRP